MGLVTKITRRIAIPHEEGQWLELRMLSWLQLDAARQARLVVIAEQARIFAGLRDLLPAAAAQKDAEAAVAGDQLAAQLAAYDRLTLLRVGVIAWSYGDTPDVDQLDERTAEWACREILELAIPQEGETKKVSSPSTGT